MVIQYGTLPQFDNLDIGVGDMKKLKGISHGNGYYGRSLTALFIHNLYQGIGFFRRRGPKRQLLESTILARNSKIGKTALIIGSGPSLDLLDPLIAKDAFDDVFAVNSYYKYEHSKFLTPDFYALSDPNFFLESKKIKFHENSELYKYLEEFNPKLIIPHLNRNQIPTLPNEILFFDDRELPRFFKGGISPLKPRGYVSLTLYKALAMAVHLGYKEIYVIGLDNSEFKSYHANHENLISRKSSEYFPKSLYWGDMPEYSNPEKLPGGMAGQLQVIALFFGDLYRFPADRIFNLDEGSLVDAFKKVRNHPAIKLQNEI